MGRSDSQKNYKAGRQKLRNLKKTILPFHSKSYQVHTKFSAMNNYKNTYIFQDFTRLVSYVKENKTIRSNNHVYMMPFRCNSINYADNPRSNYAITWL